MSKSIVFSTYRNLTRLIKNLPSKQERIKSLETLRATYRSNALIEDPDRIKDCVKEAGEKIAYLRIVTPKGGTSTLGSNNGSKRFIYTKDGVVEVDENGGGTRRDSNGRVVSNWDGKNLDPCAVKTHNSQLKRMGFMNNLHAKGIF
jgi:hypothetical protein